MQNLVILSPFSKSPIVIVVVAWFRTVSKEIAAGTSERRAWAHMRFPVRVDIILRGTGVVTVNIIIFSVLFCFSGRHKAVSQTRHTIIIISRRIYKVTCARLIFSDCYQRGHMFISLWSVKPHVFGSVLRYKDCQSQSSFVLNASEPLRVYLRLQAFLEVWKYWNYCHVHTVNTHSQTEWPVDWLTRWVRHEIVTALLVLSQTPLNIGLNLHTLTPELCKLCTLSKTFWCQTGLHYIALTYPSLIEWKKERMTEWMDDWMTCNSLSPSCPANKDGYIRAGLNELVSEQISGWFMTCGWVS